TARLEHQGQVATGDALTDLGNVIAGQRRLFVAVLHAQAATQVEVLDMDAALGEAVDEYQQALEGVEKGCQGGQLRTDVAIDANHLQVGQFGGAGIDRFGLLDVDAELVFLEPGGDVRVGAGVHVRIDAQRHRCLDVQFGGLRSEERRVGKEGSYRRMASVRQRTITAAW